MLNKLTSSLRKKCGHIFVHFFVDCSSCHIQPTTFPMKNRPLAGRPTGFVIPRDGESVPCRLKQTLLSDDTQSDQSQRSLIHGFEIIPVPVPGLTQTVVCTSKSHGSHLQHVSLSCGACPRVSRDLVPKPVSMNCRCCSPAVTIPYLYTSSIAVPIPLFCLLYILFISEARQA